MIQRLLLKKLQIGLKLILWLARVRVLRCQKEKWTSKGYQNKRPGVGVLITAVSFYSSSLRNSRVILSVQSFKWIGMSNILLAGPNVKIGNGHDGGGGGGGGGGDGVLLLLLHPLILAVSI